MVALDEPEVARARDEKKPAWTTEIRIPAVKARTIK
jgi:hypothetical protein